MIGFENQDLLSLRNVARQFGVDIRVVHRWILRGGNGRRLRATNRAGEKQVTKDELAGFLQGLKGLGQK